jgi:hypothetical protein
MAVRPCPPGECRQCWRHAHDPSIHRSQDQGQDCAQCVDHMNNGHGNQLVPKKESSWW